MAENVLYYGDNLDVLRQHVKDETVDLVYLDPPFNSAQDYNVLFAEHGARAAAQIKAFEDTWQWAGPSAEWREGAHDDRWALGLVGARPAEEKKGADKGIDGRLFFHDEKAGKTKQAILSVKAGGVTVSQLRDLRGVVEREKAEIGVLITLEEATKPMRVEAASAGFYSSPLGTKHATIQIVTVGDLLAGKTLDLPSRFFSTFKAAPKTTAPEPENLPLLAAETVEPYGGKKPKKKGGK